MQCATYIAQVLETETVQQSLREIITQLYELILQAVQDLALDVNMMSVFTYLIDYFTTRPLFILLVSCDSTLALFLHFYSIIITHL